MTEIGRWIRSLILSTTMSGIYKQAFAIGGLEVKVLSKHEEADSKPAFILFVLHGRHGHCEDQNVTSIVRGLLQEKDSNAQRKLCIVTFVRNNCSTVRYLFSNSVHRTREITAIEWWIPRPMMAGARSQPKTTTNMRKNLSLHILICILLLNYYRIDMYSLQSTNLS